MSKSGVVEVVRPVESSAETQRRDLTSPDVRTAIMDELASQVSLIQEAMGRVLEKGVHYGTIPGTFKPSLWQPGAEALCQMFGFQTAMIRTDQYEDWEHGIFSYTYKCELRDKRGELITVREATCSTEEVRYKSAQGSGRPAAELRETIMQMAQKRAYVSAVKASAAASAIFSMDDDIVAQDRPAASSQAGSEWGVCPEHGVPFFKTRNMRGPAHKPVDGGSWCDYDDVLAVEAKAGVAALDSLFGKNRKARKEFVEKVLPAAKDKLPRDLTPEQWRMVTTAAAEAQAQPDQDE